MKVIKLLVFAVALPISASNRFEKPAPSAIQSLGYISMGVTFLLGSCVTGSYAIESGNEVLKKIGAPRIANDAEQAAIAAVKIVVSQKVDQASQNIKERYKNEGVMGPTDSVFRGGINLLGKGINWCLGNKKNNDNPTPAPDAKKADKADQNNSKDQKPNENQPKNNNESNAKPNAVPENNPGFGRQFLENFTAKVKRLGEAGEDVCKTVGWGTLSITLGASGIYYIGKGLGLWGYGNKAKDKKKTKIRRRTDEE